MSVVSQVGDPGVTTTEAAVLGLTDREAIDAWVATTTGDLLGEPVSSVLFRAGRIDAVYGVETASGRQLLLKVHRQPVDLAARTIVARAQKLLAQTGFPCAEPILGPLSVDDKIISVETLLSQGQEGDGHDPAIRIAIAEGLARHVSVLETHPDLIKQIGPPPAWCDYTQGAWGRTHDPFFDFRVTPLEYVWLQELAQNAADLLMAHRHESAPVAAHADWYCGNLRFDGARFVATYDWDLIADREPVVVGIAAATFSGEPAPTPAETVAFLHEYEDARGVRFSRAERAAAKAAAHWNLAYAARCDVTNLQGKPAVPGSALDRLSSRRSDDLDLDGWSS